MHDAAQFIAFLAMAFGLAIAVWPVLSLRGLPAWLAFAVGAIVLFIPLVIAPPNVKLRALACVLAIELFFKLTDYAAHRRAAAGQERHFLSYAKFLVPFPVFLVRFGQPARRSPSNLSDWFAMVSALIAFALCFALVEGLSHAAMVRSSFLLDHTVKFVVFIVAIESLARSLCGMERLAGYRTKPLIDDAFRSRTVGEFWCRYNTRVHNWFEHNVFRPSGGGRWPVRAVFLTFFVSSVLHELGFAIATSRWDGYQFAFFMLQAPAVILGRHVQRIATHNTMATIVLRGLTILWMWATSMLFFHGVNRVFPFFYASDSWLP